MWSWIECKVAKRATSLPLLRGSPSSWPLNCRRLSLLEKRPCRAPGCCFVRSMSSSIFFALPQRFRQRHRLAHRQPQASTLLCACCYDSLSVSMYFCLLPLAQRSLRALHPSVVQVSSRTSDFDPSSKASRFARALLFIVPSFCFLSPIVSSLVPPDRIVHWCVCARRETEKDWNRSHSLRSTVASHTFPSPLTFLSPACYCRIQARNYHRTDMCSLFSQSFVLAVYRTFLPQNE